MSGGCIISWKRSYILQNSWATEHTCTAQLLQISTGRSMVVTTVYGPSEEAESAKVRFFNEIRYTASLVRFPWLLAGDFNVVRWLVDRSGAMRGFNCMSKFNELISDLQLIDVPLRNKKYTWTNKQPVPLHSKLDRIFITADLPLIFPIIALQALPMTVSDHVPLLLSCKQRQPIKPFPKMELCWFKYDILKNKVEKQWDDGLVNSLESFNVRTTLLQQQMTQWHKQNFSDAQLKLDYCKKEILSLDCLEEERPLQQHEFQHRINMRERAYELAILIETRWRQRARCNWLKEGDRNTRFFHAFASARTRNNAILSLSHDGQTVTDQQSIANAFYESLKNLLGNSKETIKFDPTELYQEQMDLSHLQEMFQENEVAFAVQN